MEKKKKNKIVEIFIKTTKMLLEKIKNCCSTQSGAHNSHKKQKWILFFSFDIFAKCSHKKKFISLAANLRDIIKL